MTENNNDKFTDPFIDKQLRIAEEAMGLPWECDDKEPWDIVIWDKDDEFITNIGDKAGPCVAFDHEQKNGQFIVESCNHYPDALKTIRALREENVGLLKVCDKFEKLKGINFMLLEACKSSLSIISEAYSDYEDEMDSAIFDIMTGESFFDYLRLVIEKAENPDCEATEEREGGEG